MRLLGCALRAAPFLFGDGTLDDDTIVIVRFRFALVLLRSRALSGRGGLGILRVVKQPAGGRNYHSIKKVW